MEIAEPLISPASVRWQGGGRRRVDDRADLAAIVYVTNAPLPTQGIDAGKKSSDASAASSPTPSACYLAAVVTATGANGNSVGIVCWNKPKHLPGPGQDPGRRRLQEQGHRTRCPWHRRRSGRQRPAGQGILGGKPRWVVERSLGWIMLHRRQARDYDALPDNSASRIRIAMIDNLAKRLTNETTQPGEITEGGITRNM